jgi:DNA polymerase
MVAARLGVKSTLEETRTTSLIGVAERGPLPIMLNYYGAHTGRFSGGDKMNLQNLPRGGTLRKALCAPAGKVLVASDSSQIEARIVAWVAGQENLLHAFREGRDVYSEFASEVYGRKITKADKLERHVGKTAVLGLGYGMGFTKFKMTLALGAGGIKVEMEEDEAKRIVQTYRQKYARVPTLWDRCGWALREMAQGKNGEIRPYLPFGPEWIGLPNGMQLNYPLLQVETGGFKFIGDPRAYIQAVKAKVVGSTVPVKWTYVYGGKITENIVQALARIVVAEQMVKVGQRYKTVLQVHDEIVCMVDEDEADEALAYIEDVMKTPPSWAPDLPVNCEAHVGKNYGEVK